MVMPVVMNIGLTKILIKDNNKPKDDLDNTRPITLSDTKLKKLTIC